MQTIGIKNNTGEAVTKQSSLLRLLSLFTFILTAGLGLASGSVGAEQQITPATTLAADTELENTERNVRDRNESTLTPEDQKETSADRKITESIRKNIVKQKSLSTDAHNAKIITRNGVVTLRGPVENAKEKNQLQSIAKKMHGVKQVDNQLEPKTP